MGMGEAGMSLVAGIGCRRGASMRSIACALDHALQVAGRGRGDVAMLASIARKRDEAGLAAMAAHLGVALLFIDDASAETTLTDSAASRGATGLGSVAEAAALAGAGSGARLLGPRSASDAATCALAEAPR